MVLVLLDGSGARRHTWTICLLFVVSYNSVVYKAFILVDVFFFFWNN